MVAAQLGATSPSARQSTSPGLLCVHPHPDDETLSCGGVLARYTDEGFRVMVVTCTGGELGRNLSGIDLDGRDMTTVRRDELAAALTELGVSEHRWLGYRDSGMIDDPANRHPRAFAGADDEEAAGRLAAIIREFRPAVVVSDGPEGTYGHPDHVKAYAVTTRAVELAAEPAGDGRAGWAVGKRYTHALPRSRVIEFHRRMREAGLSSPFGDQPITDPQTLPLGVDDERITTAVDVRPWLERKRAALRAHASQIRPESYYLGVPDELARELFGVEYYVLEGSAAGVSTRGEDPPGDGPGPAPPSAGTGAPELEEDLFAGLRRPGADRPDGTGRT